VKPSRHHSVTAHLANDQPWLHGSQGRASSNRQPTTSLSSLVRPTRNGRVTCSAFGVSTTEFICRCRRGRFPQAPQGSRLSRFATRPPARHCCATHTGGGQEKSVATGRSQTLLDAHRRFLTCRPSGGQLFPQTLTVLQPPLRATRPARPRAVLELPGIPNGQHGRRGPPR